MSRIGINRNKARLRGAFGIRARLVLFALILVGPLMAERIRSLHTARDQQIADATRDFADIAQHSAEAQRQVFASIEAVLKSAAFIYTSAAQVNRSCAIMRASLHGDMPWLRSLTMAGTDGVAKCSTWSEVVEQGVNFGNRPYFKKAVETGEFTVSDYVFSRLTNLPTIMAAYLVPGQTGDDDAVVLAAVNLDWMSKLMSSLGERTGVTALLVDRSGTVLATPPNATAAVGRPMADLALLPAIDAQLLNAQRTSGSLAFTADDGTRRAVSFAQIPATNAMLIVSIDEARMSAAADQAIRRTYVQLAIVCLFVLLGALVAAERMIIKPIRMLSAMTERFGRGDWSARMPRNMLPAEFVPLVRAFNGMAAQLRGRERELRASNERLTTLASVDMLSGLANRRGFQNRLDDEWLRARHAGDKITLLMIDVDCFKLFNDTYGHPEGDACLTRVGAELGALADRMSGFAARYGGEEFCMLLPGTDAASGVAIGEMARAAIWSLAVPHASSVHQRVTVSIGIAAATPAMLDNASDLIEAADAALYAAKHRGRNIVVEHGLVRSYETTVSLSA